MVINEDMPRKMPQEWIIIDEDDNVVDVFLDEYYYSAVERFKEHCETFCDDVLFLYVRVSVYKP